jgi:hypothetical protein
MDKIPIPPTDAEIRELYRGNTIIRQLEQALLTLGVTTVAGAAAVLHAAPLDLTDRERRAVELRFDWHGAL